MSEPLDLDALEAVANAATPGIPWLPESPEYRAFRSAFTPQVAIRLIDRVLSADDAAKDNLHELIAWQARCEVSEAERDRLRDQLREYERRMSWDTTCENCANLLDRSYEDHAKWEKLRDGITALADEWNGIDTWPNEQGVFEQCAAQVRAVLAPEDEGADDGQ